MTLPGGGGGGAGGSGGAGRAGGGRDLVLVLNAGSSTLKGSVVAAHALADPRRALTEAAADPWPALASLTLDWGDDASRGADVDSGVAAMLVDLRGQGVDPARLAVVAHRVVHGGDAFREPVLVDDAVLAEIEALGPLAPLHNAVAAAVIREARGALPSIPHVAAFDTSFHAALPEPVRRYPLPASWGGWGIRRYGFHGLSVAWAVARAAHLLGRPAAELELVVAHLGSGCSVTAVRAGRSVATSMGMTPLEGLMMGTRAGSIDPGIMLAVLRDGRRTLAELGEDLDHRAGLLGVSDRSADVQALQAAAAEGDERARLALEMFVDRAAAGIAAAATALGRLDALVFTGGIGEHASDVRARIVDRLAVLGLAALDPAERGPDRILGARFPTAGPDRPVGGPGVSGEPSIAGRPGGPGRPVAIRVAAREDLVAAVAALEIVAGAGAG